MQLKHYFLKIHFIKSYSSLKKLSIKTKFKINFKVSSYKCFEKNIIIKDIKLTKIVEKRSVQVYIIYLQLNDYNTLDKSFKKIETKS